MTDRCIPGDLFSLEVPSKNKPTVLYGILHRENPEIKYGILIRQKDILNEEITIWITLLEGKFEEVYINSKYFNLI